MICFKRSVMAVNGVFAVAKDNDSLRLIIDTRSNAMGTREGLEQGRSNAEGDQQGEQYPLQKGERLEMRQLGRLSELD